jgi:DNA-binding XRE family transcriptional regulator
MRIAAQHPVPQRGHSSRLPKNDHLYHAPSHVSSRFGTRLRQLRLQRNLTQMQMAVHFGINRTYISNLERGRQSITLNLLEIFALGLEMSLSDLLQDI